MVNWHNPTVLNEDYLALIKLHYVVAGIYIWELVVTAGFEFDVLRGKQPYRRTIWLYLGTRYSALFTLVIFIIRAGTSTKLSRQLDVINDVLVFTSWAFASLLITLRVIAIWDRNAFVTPLLIGTWLTDLVLYIYILVKATRTSSSDTRRFFISALSSLVTDGVLLIGMLLGIMRSSHGSSFGLWHLLYQQCFIWLVLATIADVPVMVLLILDLNDVMNEMFTGVAVVIVSIGSTRMYRSLFEHAYSTEYVSFNLPQESPKIPNPQQRAANIRSSIHFASSAQSNGTVTTPGAVMVSVRTEHVHQNTEEKTGCELA
ncbi:hypothetical protein BGW80DRAFT_857384 [Lactifluus volemus]|nr:hypothetical protein BGW80DRAFT_857384 [Lactifluus volemus]